MNNIDIKSIIKRKLKVILERYNKEIVLNFDKVYIDNSIYYIIPNNNKKYYLYITTNGNKNILYFFQNDTILTDFYFETNYKFETDILLEGYLYNDSSNFLISDVLYYENNICIKEYVERFDILENFYFYNFEKIKNNSIQIGLHMNFSNNSQNIKVFLNNFKYNSEICSYEHIIGLKKIKNIYCKYDGVYEKKITKTNYTEVYNVYNIESGNKEGILYVKNIYESKKLKELFKNVDEIVLKCIYNDTFYKWKLL